MDSGQMVRLFADIEKICWFKSNVSNHVNGVSAAPTLKEH